MLKKIINFYKNYDIRWKLKKLSNILHINIYPKHFKFNFLNKFHSKLIFNIIFNKKISEKKKNLFSFIKLMSEYKENGLNFFISTQSSGSNYLRQCINSYFELSNNLGNGIPFHDRLVDRWISSAPAIVFSDMWRSINFDRNIHFEKLTEEQKKEFFSKRIIFSRHPLVESDLFDIHDVNNKILLLVRNPSNWILSRYVYLMENKHYSKYANKLDNLNYKIIHDELLRLNRFYEYWIKHLKHKKNLVLNYDDLLKDSNKNLFKVLDFFGYENVNKELIKKCVEYNSSDFINNFYGKQDMSRFTDKNQKILIKNKIEKYVENFIEKNKINENFHNLLKL